MSKKSKEYLVKKGIETLSIGELPLHRVDVSNLHDFISEMIDSNEKARILNLNIRGANFGFKLPWFKKALQDAELVFCDGDGVRWGAKWLGFEAPEKITYDRWVWQLAAFCEKKGYKLYFLGSEPGVAEQAAARLKREYSLVQIAGTHHGYFEKEGPKNEAVIAKINEVHPDILMIGFGMPIQERWIQDNWQSLNAKVFLAGGAALECISGKLTKPPEWMTRFQLEWLYRWLQQPFKRFERYAIGIPYFFIQVIKIKLKRQV